MSMGFNIIGKIAENLFSKGSNTMNATQQRMALMPSTALFFILRDGDTKNIKLRPDLFPKDIINNNTFITMKTSMIVYTPYGHKNRYFIPFSDTDICIEDYKNGVADIYPTNRILTIEGGADYNTYEVLGVYDMASAIYDDVLLNDKWDVIDPKTRFQHLNETLIDRKSPRSIDGTPAMGNFFTNLKSGKISLGL